MTIGLSFSSTFAEDIAPSTSMVVEMYFGKNGQLGLHDEQSNGNERSVKNATLDSLMDTQLVATNLPLEDWNSPGQHAMGSAPMTEESAMEGKFHELSDSSGCFVS